MVCLRHGCPTRRVCLFSPLPRPGPAGRVATLDSFVLIGRHGSFVDVLLWWVVWVIHFHHGVGLISLDYGFDSSNEFVLDSQVMIKVRDMYWENANSCGFWVCVWYLTCTGTWLPFMNGKFRFWDGYAEFMPEVSCFIPMVGM